MAYKQASCKIHKTAGKFIRRKVVFTCKADKNSTVFLAGDFNNWNATAKQMLYKEDEGLFSCIVYIMPGKHEYKFVINGEWIIDQDNQDKVSNGVSSENSVIVVD